MTEDRTISFFGPSHPTEGCTTLRCFINGEPIYVPLGWRGLTVKYEVTVPIRKAAEQKI